MGWVIAYAVVGMFTALVGYGGMRNAGHGKPLSVKRAVQLLFFWPIMYAYALVVAAFFMIFGGLF